MTSLNELAAEIHQISKSKGFWGDTLCPNKYCQHPTPRHPAEVILLMGTEVTEAWEAVRDGHALNDDATQWISGPNTRSHTMTQYPGHGHILTHLDGHPCIPPRPMTDDLWKELGFEAKPVGVPSELADIIIRTLDAAAAWGIDIDAAVRRKIAYNATRPHKHGRQS